MEKDELIKALKDVFLEIIKEPDIQHEIQKLSKNGLMRSRSIIANSTLTTEDCGESQSVHTGKSPNSAVMNKLDTMSSALEGLKTETNTLKGMMSDIRSKITPDRAGEIEELRSQNQTIKDKNQELQQKYNTLLDENRKLNNECNTIKNRYNPFDKLVKIWEELKLLDDDCKSYIENLCGSFDLYSCLSLGRDSGKVNQFWLYLKETAVSFNNNYASVKILSDYFEFCIMVANSSRSKEERFSLFDIDIGADFDFNQCIKTSNSKQIGVVTRIVSKGVKIRDKIIYQAIVEVG